MSEQENETQIELLCRVAGGADPEGKAWIRAFHHLVATGSSREEASDFLVELVLRGDHPPTPKVS